MFVLSSDRVLTTFFMLKFQREWIIEVLFHHELSHWFYLKERNIFATDFRGTYRRFETLFVQI